MTSCTDHLSLNRLQAVYQLDYLSFKSMLIALLSHEEIYYSELSWHTLCSLAQIASHMAKFMTACKFLFFCFFFYLILFCLFICSVLFCFVVFFKLGVVFITEIPTVLRETPVSNMLH